MTRNVKQSSRVGILCVWLCLLCLYFTIPPTILAAPDPAEVERLKKDAPIHLTGTVVKDELLKDLSSEKERYLQLRKSIILVEEWHKSQTNGTPDVLVEVIYSYIPTWQSHQYNGGRSMDMAVGDVVEIWLKEGEYGLEPVLGGNTVNHIHYVENRIAPISEPFLHMSKRYLNKIWDTNTALVVLLVLSVFVTILILTYRRK